MTTLLDRMRKAAPCRHGLKLPHSRDGEHYEDWDAEPNDCNGVDLTLWNELVEGLIEAATDTIAQVQNLADAGYSAGMDDMDNLRSALTAIQREDSND